MTPRPDCDESAVVAFGREAIRFNLRYTRRKTLAITVHPDLSVTVTAPQGAEIEQVKAKVRRRAGWILKQQQFFRPFLPLAPPRRYVSGETHYYLGRQYRLKVIESQDETVKLLGGYLEIYVSRRRDRARVEALLFDWYLSHARVRFARSMEAGWEKLKRQKIPAPQLSIRRMKKRWGGCSRAGAVYLNLELIKAPSYCIDYVVMHELCHLKHPNHSRQFYDMLRRFMPDWKDRKARLERMSVALNPDGVVAC
jgi:predicted metal-dependent hydrolase